MSCELTVEDQFMSLNGFDEIAIAKAFGEDISDLRSRPFMFIRALVFVDLRRGGQRDPEAKQQAFDMPLSAVQDYFADDPGDVDPDDPDSDVGKGAGPSL